jgi:outer membrane lipoprotein SlyB
MRNRIHTAPVLLAALLALGACVSTGPTYPTTTYAQPSVQRAAVAQYGVIVDVRTVSVRNQGDEVAGAVVGAVVGGIIGNQFGNGRGNDVMTGLGAVGGAVAGSQIAGNAQQLSQEWTVRLNNGRSIAVVQNSSFFIGQPVQVVFNADGRARIAAR